MILIPATEPESPACFSEQIAGQARDEVKFFTLHSSLSKPEALHRNNTAPDTAG